MLNPIFLALTPLVATHLPNVIIIMTDEHNFRTLGCYRALLSDNQALQWGEGCVVQTPNIDFLADNGVLCSNVYASNPVSGPSRSSFMTGCYPQATGVEFNNSALNAGMTTFADILSQNSYRTGYFGKWHLDGDSKPGWTPSQKHGWEDNLYMYNRGHWKKLGIVDGTPEVLSVDLNGRLSESVLSGADEQSFTTDFLTDRAIDFIDRNKDNRFCCFISIPDPHGKNIVRPPYDTMYADMDYQKPSSAFTDCTGWPSWAQSSEKTILEDRQMGIYFGMVKCIDDNIGKLLDYLRLNGLDENTMIIFTSDHGDLLGEHGRDNKSVPFEASAKIPYIWYYPSSLPSGRVVSTAMSNVDFFPTLMGVLGIRQRVHCHGKDFSRLLKGKRRDSYNVAVSKNNVWIMATDGLFKLILTAREGASPVLFDLQKDPDETVNVFNDASYSAVKKKLASAMKSYCISTREPFWEGDRIPAQIQDILR